MRAIEREIEKQEAALADLEAEIQASGADYQALTALLAQKEQVEGQLSELMEQWETLSLQLEGGA